MKPFDKSTQISPSHPLPQKNLLILLSRTAGYPELCFFIPNTWLWQYAECYQMLLKSKNKSWIQKEYSVLFQHIQINISSKFSLWLAISNIFIFFKLAASLSTGNLTPGIDSNHNSVIAYKTKIAEMQLEIDLHKTKLQSKEVSCVLSISKTDYFVNLASIANNSTEY